MVKLLARLAETQEEFNFASRLRNEWAKKLSESGIPQWNLTETWPDPYVLESKELFLVVSEDGELVCAALLQNSKPGHLWGKEFDCDEDVLYLSSVMIDPKLSKDLRFIESDRSTLGKRCLDAIASAALDLGASAIRLDCFAGNKFLNRFFFRTGFARIGQVSEDHSLVSRFQRTLCERESILPGGCHCGAVMFKVRVRVSEKQQQVQVIDCNCNICTKKGILHLVVDPKDFEPLSGCDEARDSEVLGLYEFGSREAKHRFCRNCGIAPFYRAKSHPNHFTVNLRCIENFRHDLSNWGLPFPISVVMFDGRDNYDSGVEGLRTQVSSSSASQ